MDAARELKALRDDILARLPPAIPVAAFDAFMRRNEAALLAMLAEHDDACAVQEVASPPSPHALQRDVLAIVYELLDERPATPAALAREVRARGHEVGPDVLWRWMYRDPYIRYDDDQDEFRSLPRMSDQGPPPPWADRRKYADLGEVWLCTDCRAHVAADDDPTRIRHEPLCPRGPLQFAAQKLPTIERFIDELNRRAQRLGVGGGLSIRVRREFLYPVHVGPFSSSDSEWDCSPQTRPSHWRDLPHVEVEVSGEVPKIPGWTVLGVIEHPSEDDGAELGVIVREVPGQTVPAHYWKAGPDCEHCKLKRRRKETVVLQDESGRTMTIGRTCLADYTGSSDADARIQAFLTWQEYWRRINDLVDDNGLDQQWALDPTVRAVSLIRFLGWTCGCVRAEGFMSKSRAGSRNSTAECAMGAEDASKGRDAKVTAPAAEELGQAETIRAWAREHLTMASAQTSFDRNLATIVARDYVEPSTASLAVWIFQKWQQATTARTPRVSAWRPESEGEKVTLRLTVIRVRPEAAESDYGPRDLYVLADEEGRELVLFTSAKNGPQVGDVVEMNAEIVKHDTYRGHKQTMISKRSRGWKIVERASTPGVADAEEEPGEPATADDADDADDAQDVVRDDDARLTESPDSDAGRDVAVPLRVIRQAWWPMRKGHFAEQGGVDGKVTEIEYRGARAWVRENVDNDTFLMTANERLREKRGDKVRGVEILELVLDHGASFAWDELAALVTATDPLRRAVRANRRFTVEWARRAMEESPVKQASHTLDDHPKGDENFGGQDETASQSDESEGESVSQSDEGTEASLAAPAWTGRSDFATRRPAQARSISSDDPEAPAKILAKIDELERSVDRWKTLNKAVRSKDPRKALAGLGLPWLQIENLLRPDFAGRVGVPDYKLTNTNAEIRRLKKRLAELESAAMTTAPDPVELGGAVAEWRTDENRIVVQMPRGPLTPAEKRRRHDIMRSRGFVWSPTESAYVRKANQGAWYHAQRALEALAQGAPASTEHAPST